MKKQVIIDILFTAGAAGLLIIINQLFGLSVFAWFTLIPILMSYHIGKAVGKKFAGTEKP
jgi:hypothetical protein